VGNPKQARQPRVLSGSEVRSLLGGVSRSTLHRWQAEGKFPARRQVGPRRVGFLEAEVVAFIESLPCAPRREAASGNSGARS
jgi:prophage regulatory protein